MVPLTAPAGGAPMGEAVPAAMLATVARDDPSLSSQAGILHKALLDTQASLHSTIAAQAKIAAEINSIQEKLRDQQNEEKKKRSLISSAAAAYSQAWCLDFSAKIARKLPPELRDMIYEYLCDEDFEVVIGSPCMLSHRTKDYSPELDKQPGKEQGTEQDTEQDTEWEPDKAPFYSCYKGRKTYRPGDNDVGNGEHWRQVEEAGWKFSERVGTLLPHWCFAKYVGPEFVQELAPIFYKNTIFTLQQHNDIGDFLQFDILRSGCTAKDHVRKLNLVIHIHGDDRKEHDDVPIPPKGYEAGKVSALSRLLEFKQRSGFRLNMFNDRWSIRFLVRYERALLPHLITLKDAGFIVDIPFSLVMSTRGNPPIGGYDIQNGFSSLVRIPEDDENGCGYKGVLTDQALAEWKRQVIDQEDKLVHMAQNDDVESGEAVETYIKTHWLDDLSEMEMFIIGPQ